MKLLALTLCLLTVLTGNAQSSSSGAAPSGGGVTSVAMTVPAFLSIAGSPITSSGTLAVSLSGTALPIANGGTASTSAASALTALGGANTSLSNLASVLINTNLIFNTGSSATIQTKNENSPKELVITTGNGVNPNGPIGNLQFATGDNNGTGGSGASAGDLRFSTGTTLGGTGDTSGNMIFVTGSNGYQTGDIQMATGAGTVVDTGYSGNFSAGTGSVTGTAVSGNVRLYTGSAGSSGTKGHLQLEAHIETTGTAPGLATGATDCGTTPAIVGNDVVGRVTVGSGVNGGKCTLTFDRPWTNAPICFAEDETTGILVRATNVGTTSFRITGAMVAGDGLTYHCLGYN